VRKKNKNYYQEIMQIQISIYIDVLAHTDTNISMADGCYHPVAVKNQNLNLAEYDTLRHGSFAYLQCRSCKSGSKHASQFDLQLIREKI
jgi:hypothetical protein